MIYFFFRSLFHDHDITIVLRVTMIQKTTVRNCARTRHCSQLHAVARVTYTLFMFRTLYKNCNIKVLDGTAVLWNILRCYYFCFFIQEFKLIYGNFLLLSCYGLFIYVHVCIMFSIFILNTIILIILS